MLARRTKGFFVTDLISRSVVDNNQHWTWARPEIYALFQWRTFVLRSLNSFFFSWKWLYRSEWRSRGRSSQRNLLLSRYESHFEKVATLLPNLKNQGGEATCPIGDFSRGHYSIVEIWDDGFVMNIKIDGTDGDLFVDQEHTSIVLTVGVYT